MESPERNESEPELRISVVVINNDLDMIGVLFDNLDRHGIGTVKRYDHQRDVLADLESDCFPQTDAILTELALPKTGPDFFDSCNSIALVKHIRKSGIKIPIIAVATYAFCTDTDEMRLRELGVTVDRGRFGLPIDAKKLAKEIRSELKEKKGQPY